MCGTIGIICLHNCGLTYTGRIQLMLAQALHADYMASVQLQQPIACLLRSCPQSWANCHLALRLFPAGYKIPHGGMFELVSAGNYASEILEWTGYALATGWALPARAFALFVFANLSPRGWQHHLWYKSKFDSYPKNRKAVIPFIW